MENNDYKDYKIDLKSPEGRKEFIAVMAKFGKEYVEKDGEMFAVCQDGSLYPPLKEPRVINPDEWENEPGEGSLERFEAYYAEHKEEEDDREFAFICESRGIKPEDLPAKEDRDAYQKWLDAKQSVV